jgi:hypothetical protein
MRFVIFWKNSDGRNAACTSWRWQCAYEAPARFLQELQDASHAARQAGPPHRSDLGIVLALAELQLVVLCTASEDIKIKGLVSKEKNGPEI